jgi:NADH:ubiquinone oxidoreductase subunit 6 (subunit J)
VANFLQLLWKVLLFVVVDIWPITLFVVLGGAAIYYLLPQPRGIRWKRGALLGLVALVLAGVLLVGTHAQNGEQLIQVILFYAFSAIAIVAGCLLVTQHNPARAALSFALVVLSTCGLFLLLAAPFLMVATIIIYAGAIIVMFLFVLMLAQQEGFSNADIRSREPLLASITGFVLLGALVYVIQVSYGTREIDALLQRTRQGLVLNNEAEIRTVIGEGTPQDLLKAYRDLSFDHNWPDLKVQVEEEMYKWGSTDNLSVPAMHASLINLQTLGEQARNRLACLQPPGNTPMSNLSGPPPSLPLKDLRRNASGELALPADNPAYLGKSLFTDYLLPVELGGTLLLVATVGAIAIAYRRQPARAS